MCGETHVAHHDCACHKFCGVIKLIMAGIVIGTAAGMALMYFYDHDKWLQYKAKKMVKNVQNTAQNIQSTIKSTMGMNDQNS